MRRACNHLTNFKNQKSKKFDLILLLSSAARGLLIFKLDFSTQIFVSEVTSVFFLERVV